MATNTFLIELHPRKAGFDPFARMVRAELVEAGEDPQEAVVSTQKLFKLTGDINADQAESVAHTLLVDPVVETAKVVNLTAPAEKKKTAAKSARTIPQAGWVLDVWPKPGVTDPVGETVEIGLRDMGLRGEIHASSAVRYIFPKIKDGARLEKLARQVLGNQLIHDIRLNRIS